MRPAIIAFAVLLCFGPSLSEVGGASAQETPAAAPPAADAPPAPAPTPASGNPAMTGPRLLIQTSMGDITLQLDAARAPKTVANILRYVKERHYDGTVFYRVVKGFVIEMGSWDANVKGRPGHPGIALEADNGLSNLRGTVALAHGDDPNSGQADFFINLDDNSGLDRKKDDIAGKTGFAVFGEVAAGMEVADAIAAVPVGDHGPMPGQAPVTPILIQKVSVLP
jgi:cyclophilin family peptidyl-prolyl cis-trans isomerase